MHRDGCVIILPGQPESQISVRDKSQLLTVAVMHSIELIKITSLCLHFLWQFRHIHGFDIDNPSVGGCYLELFVHLLTPS